MKRLNWLALLLILWTGALCTAIACGVVWLLGVRLTTADVSFIAVVMFVLAGCMVGCFGRA